MTAEHMDLCPPVAAWFERRFHEATEPQKRGWPAIARGEDTLIAAPTGSGKTLAAFLMVLDRLFRRAIEGDLEDRLEAVYVSPLRALSHDIQRNLEVPLEEIHAEAERQGLVLPAIRTAVRTGDTPQSARQAMLRRPPHILVTTPESLYLLLTAERSRQILKSVRTVIVDEIHALARDKRGSHLALSLERLEALAEMRPARVGLSATQRPVDRIARYLVGAQRGADGAPPECTVIDLGHQRDLDLAIEIPPVDDLQSVASKEQWDDLLDVIAGYVAKHRTTLIFTNTRRLTERLAHRLGEKVGPENVAAHHGSLARDRRLNVERRLKDGDLRALVATASLELGIDIGSVELVCQIGSPRSIATLLQRIGRSGHALGLQPRGRLFPTSRDELVECAALVRAVRAGHLDRIHPPEAPLDILAQQIVAACACEEWGEDELFEFVRGAHPYRSLERADFDAVLDMLSQGFETPRGRRATFVHRDRVARRLRGRRGARMAAILSGGAIPETGDYRVVLDPEETLVGTVNEDWAIESMPGDVFLLGTHSWRIRRIESAVVRVVDAQGAPPTIPFWLGEAPARTEELSREVSELRQEVAMRIVDGMGAATAWLESECGLAPEAALQLAHYVRIQIDSVGRVPTCEDLVAERFFDDAGGMQLVIHSPWGARINRGFALALRKRFCVSFNTELQAAATDDALVLSLGSPQTFPLESIRHFLSSKTLEDVLSQALLASPLFTARWRWNATRSLAVARVRTGGRVPLPVQRMQADDLLGCVFPDQVACQENVEYPIAIPDHPLVKQTMRDCLTEATDLQGVVRLLERMEAGEVRIHCLDTVAPSPFTHEILNARPYAFLDDAPLEERRTRAVALRHVLPDEAQDLGRLEPEAIERVRGEARPDVRSADELCDLLVDLGVARPEDLPADAELARELILSGRAARVLQPDGARLFAVERLGYVSALFPDAEVEPAVQLPTHIGVYSAEFESTLDAAVRGHLAVLGPTDSLQLARRIGVSPPATEAALARLESAGVAVRGRFEPEAGEQFCDRGLLARIHRYTLARLRREIEPVSAGDYLAFLLRWQHAHPEDQLYGEGGLLKAIEQLSGFEAAAAAWEPGLLQTRVRGYEPAMLDALCLNGSVAWGRLGSPVLEAGAQPSRATPIALFARDEMEWLLHGERDDVALRGPGERVLEQLRQRGALFARELTTATGLLPIQVDEGLRELVAQGLVTCDGFAPLRRLLGSRRHTHRRRRDVRDPEGRWGILRPLAAVPDREARAEQSARRLLRRYGVVFRELLAREWVPEGWRDVHRALRTLEARGLVRGGRFVSGFTGEQFALPEAVPLLRKQRDRARPGHELRVSAADPLNLQGILTPGPRVPAGHARWLVFRDGIPVSAIERGQRVGLSDRSPLPGAEFQLGA